MIQATALLVLSYAPGLGGADRQRLEARAGAALRRVTGDEPARVPLPGGAVLTVGGAPADAQSRGGDGVVGLSLGIRTSDGRIMDAGEVASRLEGRHLADVVPPFAACLAPGGQGDVVVATDAVGLRHVSWVRAPGWAGVSTSSLALAAVADAAFDEEALGIFAVVGNHIGERTPFSGVRLLPEGATVRMSSGQVDLDRHETPTAAPARHLEGERAVAAGVEVVRELVAACLRAYPDPLLELSGGLDSRMLLAAIPPPARRGLRAATVGPSGSPDHRVAASLARRYGMAHTEVTLDGLATLPLDEVAELTESAALGRDGGGNPVAHAVLDWQERGLDQGPRLSGQNGEFARGFYYPGQRDHPAVTTDLVDALARWRIFTNEAADQQLFAAGFVDDMRSAALRAVRQAFAAYGAGWLAATDEFYLRERMRRWVGIAYSTTSTRRVVQAPFFHGPYLEWARACAPADKRGSRLFAKVLARLDPELAAMPLESGRSPRALVSPSPVERLAGGRATLRKVLRKVDQRVRQRGKPPGGAALVAGGVQRAWARHPESLSRVAALPFLDARAVEEVGRGQRQVNPASVGLLVDLDVALRTVR